MATPSICTFEKFIDVKVEVNVLLLKSTLIQYCHLSCTSIQFRCHMRNCILLFLLLLIGPSSFAGKFNFLHFQSHEAKIGLASNTKLHAGILSYTSYWRLGSTKCKFQSGLGLRMGSTFGGSSTRYPTAPAYLTKGSSSFGALFKPRQEKNIDTLNIAASQTTSFNVQWVLRYQVNSRWALEFNTDLIGFSFGGAQDATLYYGEHNNAKRNTKATPSNVNGRLLGDHNWGTLYTECNVQYLLKGKHRLSVGIHYMVNEYIVDKPVLYTNSNDVVVSTDRYRSKSILGSLAYIRRFE